MPLILGRRSLPALADFAQSNVLIAFDFDGTLAPIVVNPDRARMRVRTRRLLEMVAVRYPCVVISGRAREDVSRRVNVPVWHISGNHGLEPWGQDAAYVPQVREWVRRLAPPLEEHAGVVIENKRYSITVHYRRAVQKRKALAAIHEQVRHLRGARVVGGNKCVSLIPVGAPHKGIALERARQLLACDRAIYVGDDETDEDAFRTTSPGQLLSIRIGARGKSHARFRLVCQSEIDDLLRVLLALRPVRQSRGA